MHFTLSTSSRISNSDRKPQRPRPETILEHILGKTKASFRFPDKLCVRSLSSITDEIFFPRAAYRARPRAVHYLRFGLHGKLQTGNYYGAIVALSPPCPPTRPPKFDLGSAHTSRKCVKRGCDFPFKKVMKCLVHKKNYIDTNKKSKFFRVNLLRRKILKCKQYINTHILFFW